MRNWNIIHSGIKNVLLGKKGRVAVRKELAISKPTWNRWLKAAAEKGVETVGEHRHGNNLKLNGKQRSEICGLKRNSPWKSARNICDSLCLSVVPKTVENVLKKEGLWHLNIERLKPLQRFVASRPNDLWQTDIMGRIVFLNLGAAYLIAELDDCTRFVLSSGWYRKQNKFNVFSIFYAGLAHWGKPKKSLQDKGSQYRVTGLKGEADYSAYCRLLDIELEFAHKARTKGKIERFWEFVQRDFVRDNLNVSSFEELNQKWNRWVFWYNFKFKRAFLGGKTSWEVYQTVQATKLTREQLIQNLTLEVRRKVSKESTISLAGQAYRVPPGYIDCRIWVKILGNKVYFEANNEVFWKQRLKV